MIREDVKRVVKPAFAPYDFLKALLTPAFQAVLLYRLASWFYQACGVKFVGKIIHGIMIILYRADIYPAAQIGPGLFLGHLTVVVSGYARIGRNCTLTHCNTIGAKEPMSNNAPVIGDNVLVCCGACVLGDVTVGKNVVVGANAVVMTDIPDNHIAVGVPAKAKPGANEYQKYYRERDREQSS